MSAVGVKFRSVFTEHHISMLMAGRAAEQLLLGDISIGSGGAISSDLGKATALAKAIEIRYGLGEFGHIFGEEGVVDEVFRVPGLADAVRARVDGGFRRALEVLASRLDTVKRVAAELEARGYLSSDDVDALIGPSELLGPQAKGDRILK